MNNLRTIDPAGQELVDIVNDLHERFYEYKWRRDQAGLNPDFSKARWYLGMREKRALGCCAHCVDLKAGPDGAWGEGGEFMGLPVHWVQADSHVALGEVT